MGFLMDVEFWLRFLGIVTLDLTLAGDNALVIALAVRTLPKRQQMLGRVWGTLGAVGLRLIFIFAITLLFKIPFLQAAGGLILLWIAIKLMGQGSESGHKVRHGTTLFEAIWIIILADVIMSLDNVLAVAAAAHGDMILVTFGIGLSIPIVIWGSGLLAWLMGRYQWIVGLGAAILGWVAGEMLVKDPIVHGWIEPWIFALRWLLPAALAVAVVGVGQLLGRRASPARVRK